jgi:hypothetical protein
VTEFVVAGPDWIGPPEWTSMTAHGVIEAEPPDAEPPADRTRRYRCGWGGREGCTVRLEQRGLCDDHRAVIRAAMEREPRASKRTPTVRGVAAPKAVPRHKVDPADVFSVARSTALARGHHLARYVHRHGVELRRVDAATLAGLRADADAKFIDKAVEHGWLVRGDLGSVKAGPTVPPETLD